MTANHENFLWGCGGLTDFFPEWSDRITFGLFMHQDGVSGTECVSILSLLMFAEVKSGAILKPNDLMALGLFHKDLWCHLGYVVEMLLWK